MKTDAPVITRRPCEMTDEDKRLAIEWLATLDMTELRRRQAITTDQIQDVYRRYHDRAMPPYIELGLEDLSAMEDQVFLAIWLKNFGHPLAVPPNRTVDIDVVFAEGTT